MFLKDDVEVNIHSSMISSILPDVKYYVKENTRSVIKTDKFIKKVGIEMNKYFNEFSNASIKQSINTSIVEWCNYIGNFNPELLVIPTNGNRKSNRTNEENKLVNDCIPKTFNTFSDVRENVEVTNVYKMSLNFADQKRIQGMIYIIKNTKPC